MDDDGLLLNFAAPTASTSKVQQQPRRSQSKNNGKRPTVAAAVKNAPSEKRAERSASVSTPKTQSESKSTSSNLQQKEQQRGGEKEASRSATLSEGKASRTVTGGSSSTAKQPKSKRGTAVISSLFAGSDALQETKEKEEKKQQYDPTNAPSKVSDFDSLQLDPLLVAHLKSEKMNIIRPTGIQKTALPFLLSSSSFERDALLHAQTGSGKTLCYLLPIIQSLLPFCQSSWIDRSCLGTLAIILAPTRELARQIYEVVELLCSLHLTTKSANEDDSDDQQDPVVRRTRWIVPGLLSGGATKNHEKSRLRKGLPIIVATPGRLLDHLRNTAALDVGRLQWLVLDEADRLLQLGFEETLNDILKAIDARRRAACELQRQRMRDELGNQYTGQIFDESEILDTFGEAWWKHNRRTILCSATLDEGVQVLAGKSLHDPKLIRSDTSKESEQEADQGQSSSDEIKNAAIAAPAQLSQYYVVVPTKHRLIILLALLRRSISMSKTAKIMVFLSCTDSVDFHLAAMSGVTMARIIDENADDEEKEKNKIEYSSQLLPSTSLFKLHGSLTAQARQASLKAFSQSKQASVLFCTSVASRGLDLHVSHVVQVDPPTEKGADEYLHRIGRTARAGEIGESWLMVLPNEEECIPHYEAAIGSKTDEEKAKGVLQRREPVSILRDGFGGSDLVQTQTRATDAQMALERWTVSNEVNTGMARRAYLAHLRAYATHPPSERHIFAIAKLQLGHLAKAFSLREAPGEIRAKVQQQQKEQKVTYMGKQDDKKRKRSIMADETKAIASSDKNADASIAEVQDNDDDDDDDIFDGRKPAKLQFQRNEDTEARMYAKVRELGKLHKRQGIMGNYGGADEFHIS